MKQQLAQLKEIVTFLENDQSCYAGYMGAKDILARAIGQRKKILVVGNGASAGEAQRFALAFVTKFGKEHAAYPALSLASDPSLLTAIANDYGFAEEFARQVEAMGEEGDILVALSVSGNSDNVIRAIDVAKRKGMKVVSLIGKGGGKMKGMGHAEIIVPSDSGPRIQEMHLVFLDILCEEMEGFL